MNLNDKVNTQTTTTGTSTTTNWQCPWYHPQRNIEYGWECPRCGKINAPWMPSCNCNQNWSITWTSDNINTADKSEWWKTYVTCGPADDITKDPNIYTVGGNDYQNPNTKTYENVPTHISNKTDPNSVTTAWNNSYTTNTIHTGKTNYKE